MSCRFAWALAASSLLVWACGGGDKPAAPSASPEPESAEPAFEPTPAAAPADQPGTDDGLRPHMNLGNLAHMADVDQGGLFIDFGTPAADKYVSGGFKTGWGKAGTEGDTTYTHVASETGRVYFPIEGDGPHTLSFRVKPVGTRNMQIFLNGDSLPLVRMQQGGGFQVHDVEVPAESVKDGENHLLLRFGGTSKVGGEDVSVAMDYIQVRRGPPAAEGQGAVPRYAQLSADLDVGGVKRKALVVKAPTRLSWYLEVPPKAALSFRVGQAGATGGKARITATTEGGEPEQLFESALDGSWKAGVLKLDHLQNQVVRLDLTSEGAGAVGWASPTLLVPEQKVAKVEPVKNVVVLLIDTLRADKLRAYDKQSRVETPALDQFAKEGTVFENAQSPENWTKPSVASVLTGLYPVTHQTKKSESKLPDSALMVSEVYKNAGFATATFLANGYVSDKFGFKQGWDHYTNYIREKKSTEAGNVFKEAGDWIEKHKDERFFVYIQTIDPHVPYDPPEEFLKKYDAREYSGVVGPRKTPDLLEKAKRKPPKVTFNARDRERLEALHDGEISYHDSEMGKLVERLKAHGLYDQTLFVVTSDHGEEFYEHGSYGHGHSVYQEMIHVPLMFRLPGVVPAGQRIGETVGTLDIPPTILAATGVAVPDVMEGVNRMPHMMGDVPAGPAVGFSDFLDDRRVIRAGRWKLILRGINATFFDLQRDPGEQKELPVEQHPIAMRYLRTMLGQFVGASDLKNWLSPEQTGEKKTLQQEDTVIDESTREGLKALGYAN